MDDLHQNLWRRTLGEAAFTGLSGFPPFFAQGTVKELVCVPGENILELCHEQNIQLETIYIQISSKLKPFSE